MEEWAGGWRRCLTLSFEGWGEIYQFGEYTVIEPCFGNNKHTVLLGLAVSLGLAQRRK